MRSGSFSSMASSPNGVALVRTIVRGPSGGLGASCDSAEPGKAIAIAAATISLFDILVPLGGDLFMTVWVAEFTPAAGSTGRFADVIGGSFIMTAVTDPFALGDTDIPYTWEGSGTLEFRRGK